VFFGSLRAIATNSSLTLVAVFALVSIKKMPLSLAYDSASCQAEEKSVKQRGRGSVRLRQELRARCSVMLRPAGNTQCPPECTRTSGSTLRFELKSDLLPASAITMLGLPCRCSSFTHCFARLKVSCVRATA
jgi:hypothetical protein